jgi:hypothetical protein
MSIAILLSVAIVFGMWAWGRFSFSLALTVFVMGLFFLEGGNSTDPSRLILGSIDISGVQRSGVINNMIFALVIANLALGAVYFAEIVGLWMANALRGKYSQKHHFERADFASIADFSAILGFYLLLSSGGMGMMWEALSHSEQQLNVLDVLQNTLVPLGSLILTSAFVISLIFFFVLISFDLLVIATRRLVAGPFLQFPIHSLRVCVLILFLSSSLYALSEEFSLVLSSAFDELPLGGR